VGKPDTEWITLIALDMGERVGLPSRWNTLRAMRVLAWSGRAG
jgi:hypothetical protein